MGCLLLNVLAACMKSAPPSVIHHERQVHPMEYSAAHRLANELRQSEEYMTYHRLKDEVMADETQAALIREYKKLQIQLQMAAMSGQQPDSEDMQRFSGISALLFGKPEISQYLLAEMRLQQAMADIFKIITDAAGLDMQLPGM